MKWASCFLAGAFAVAGLAVACSSSSGNDQPPGADGGDAGDDQSVRPDTGGPDAGDDTYTGFDGPLPEGPPPGGTFCDLPGSIVFTAQGKMTVPGTDPTGQEPDLSWVTLPAGFCLHYFGNAPSVRQMRFAPGGDLFAASPGVGTVGGASQGAGAILVLPDDNRDGWADGALTYLGGLTQTAGLMFGNSSFYYQDGTSVMKLPFQQGDRTAPGAGTKLTQVTTQQAAEHWPKVMDIAQDGTIYVSNASTQSEQCMSTRPLYGAIFSVQSDGSLVPVTKGFRNPIAMRCESNHDVCLAAELVLDGSGSVAHEKLIPVRMGDDWGFPCCATTNKPYPGVTYQDTGTTPDCSGIASEDSGFIVGDTPFGLDFEPGMWPAPWTGRVFVALHGTFGLWKGARVISVQLDPNTGLPVAGNDEDAGMSQGAVMADIATGWDDGSKAHGRPAAVAFAPDGRLFVGNDFDSSVIWIAPVNLPRP